jgi:hypothetical protein
MLAFIYFKLKVILITLTADKSPKNIKTKTEKEQSHELPGTTQRKGCQAGVQTLMSRET